MSFNQELYWLLQIPNNAQGVSLLNDRMHLCSVAVVSEVVGQLDETRISLLQY